MEKKEVVIYVSDNNSPCKKLLKHMDKWNVDYQTKNVTQDNAYMKDLQDQGIYGTPATFIGGEKEAVLGLQINYINHKLGIGEDFSGYQSHQE